MELVSALYGPGTDEVVLRTVCAGARAALERRLKDGVTAEQCGEAFPLAAAWLALDWLRGSRGLEGVTAPSAGDISVRREGGGDGGGLSERAWELMGPFLADEGFAFQGVKG